MIAPGSSESSDPEHNKTGEVGPKRARYESPESSTRLLNGRRKERAKKKAEDLERRKGNRRHAFEENIFYEEYAVDAHGFGGSESVHHLEHGNTVVLRYIPSL